MFKRAWIIRLGRLMDMMYTPGEISEEIGMSRETIWSDYVQCGMPHKREANRIWINGKAFRAWVLEMHERRKKELAGPGMGDGQAFCFRCNKAVEVLNPEVVPFGKVAQRIIGVCPECGTRVNRAIKGSRRSDLSK